MLEQLFSDLRDALREYRQTCEKYIASGHLFPGRRSPSPLYPLDAKGFREIEKARAAFLACDRRFMDLLERYKAKAAQK